MQVLCKAPKLSGRAPIRRPSSLRLTIDTLRSAGEERGGGGGGGRLEAHLRQRFTARFCRLTRNNACADLRRLAELSAVAAD